MSDERFKELEDNVKELSKKVSHLDKSFVEVNISLKDYVGWMKQFEKTLRNFDENMKVITGQNQKVPYERDRAISAAVDPLYKELRIQDNTFVRRKDAYLIATGIVLFFGFFSATLGRFTEYVVKDVKDDIVIAVKANTNLIKKNADYIAIHDRSRIEILRKLHTHKSNAP